MLKTYHVILFIFALFSSTSVGLTAQLSVSIGTKSIFICPGGSTEITSEVSGASGKVAYAWDVPQGFEGDINMASIIANVPGSYTLVVQDEKTLAISESVGIVQRDVNVSISPSGGTFCDGGNKLILEAITKSQNPSYNWIVPNGYSGPINEAEINANVAGSYRVRITESGCVATSAQVQVRKTKLDLGVTGANPSSVGGSDGVLTINLADGVPPYSWSYSVSGTNIADFGQTSASSFKIEDLQAGTYNVIVEDQNNCQATALFTLSNPACNLSISTEEKNPSCFGEKDGIISVNIRNGTPKYNVIWEGPSSGEIIVTEDNYTITDLPEGEYNIEVTDSEGCSDVAVVTIKAPPKINVSVTGDLQFCSEAGGTVLSVQPNNFKAYLWSTGSTASSITVTNSGNYRITVTDANSCNATASAAVVKLDPITIKLNEASSNLMESCQDACDGKVAVDISGGSGSGYSYSWVGPNGFTSKLKNIGDLCPGDYQLVVKDSEGCSENFRITITKAIPLSLDLQSSPPICAESGNGIIKAKFEGGVAPYAIAWSGEETGSQVNVTSEHTITGLDPGSYVVTITDNNGCKVNKSIDVLKKDKLTFEAKELSPSCQGSKTGSILVSGIVNGKPPFTVEWSGPSNGDETTNTTSLTIEDLAAGLYTISVVDENGCKAESMQVRVTEESEINVEIIGDLIFCPEQNSGTLSTNPSGFSSYKWSTGSSNPSINISTPMTYSVTVEDAGGCLGRANAEIKFSTKIEINTDVASSNLSVSCNGECDGKIVPKVVGGSAPYFFSWTGPGGFTSDEKDIASLCAGNYKLQIKDQNGCIGEYVQEVTNLGKIEIKLDPSPVSCPGEKDGSISSSVDGGNPPYSYMWSNGSTNPDIENLISGSYQLTVTDSNGCTSSTSGVVGEQGGTTGTISPSSAEICIGESVVLQASGGISYLWSGGETTSSITVSPASSSKYSVTITGNNTNCPSIQSAMVKVNTLEDAEILISESSGLENNDGEICAGSNVILTAVGGDKYEWSTGLNNPLVVAPLESTVYSVKITDELGCFVEQNVEVKVNPSPTAEINFVDLPFIVGQSEKISNSSIAGCGAIDDCEWTVGNEVVSSECGDLDYTFPENGVVDVTLKVENSCGCVDETTMPVDIFREDDCKLIFSIIDGDDSKCVGDEVILDLNFIPRSGCAVKDSVITVLKNGEVVNSYEIFGNKIIFTEPGNYEVNANYSDDCGCFSIIKRRVSIIDTPFAAFSDKNPTNVCSNSLAEFVLEDYDAGERVTVLYNGITSTFESGSFQLFIVGSGTQEIEITKVALGNCVESIVNQRWVVEAIDNLQVIDASYSCDDSNGTYTLTLFTTGGDQSAGLESNFSENGFVSGDSYTATDLDPRFTYDITLKRGLFCDPVVYRQDPVACNCNSNPGSLRDDYFVDCAGEFYDISDLYLATDDVNQNFDTILYVLHDGLTPGKLGVVVDIFPLSKKSITNDFEDYTPNKKYILSLVSIRKFDYEKLRSDGFSAFDFLGIEECVTVSGSVPVIWHGSQLSISGPSVVCENAYNEIFVSSGITDGSELTISVGELKAENYDYVPADKKLYVHFVSGIEEEVTIEIIAKTKHTDFIQGDTILTECVLSTEFLVEIDKSHEAPDTSRVILWPGGIFASVDTSENICHRWGRTTRISTTETIDTIFEGENDRFFFANIQDVISLNENRQIWVETYFCDDPVCFTRNIFNGEFPLNLDAGVSDDDLTIFPNPNNGAFSLRMRNDYKGNIKISIYDIHGRQIVKDQFDKYGFVINKELDLRSVPNGVYLLKLELSNGFTLNQKIVKQR